MNIAKPGVPYRRGIFKMTPVCACCSRDELRKLKEKIINENKPGSIRIVPEIIKTSVQNDMDDDLLEIEHKLKTVDLANRKEVQDEQQDDVVKKGDGMNMDMVD
ncbi:uncharacterized protein LOC117188826 [Drosophila miranda]|uniref:uncharacterized protein LOC117188826 n=1 Tax=Drosophila miranda TaxID=7229 RepID=UPI00143F5A19|nr:uncharacterized protein LOC117188826 [Drosophila miranda]